MDNKLLKSTFDTAEMSDRHMNLCKRYAEKFVKLGTAPTGILFFYGILVGSWKNFCKCLYSKLSYGKWKKQCLL